MIQIQEMILQLQQLIHKLIPYSNDLNIIQHTIRYIVSCIQDNLFVSLLVAHATMFLNTSVPQRCSFMKISLSPVN